MLLELYMPGIMIVGVAFCGAEGGGAGGEGQLNRAREAAEAKPHTDGAHKAFKWRCERKPGNPIQDSFRTKSRLHPAAYSRTRARNGGGGVLSFLVNARPAVIFPSTKREEPQ